MVTGAPAETDLLRAETFCPVAPIVPVGSLDEAIELANATSGRAARRVCCLGPPPGPPYASAHSPGRPARSAHRPREG